MAHVTIRNLSFIYPNQVAPALNQLTLELKQGEFVLLCGASGSGKTTLLRHLKPALIPAGDFAGEVLWNGAPLSDLSPRDQAAKIGFVLQSPEHQMVTDKVWHELAFGLESLGHDQNTIRLRLAEAASFFGLEHLLQRDTASLSGGQKQLVNLAAVMTLRPELLLLDEPTAMLDPIAAEDFFAMLARIHRELGTTILLSEHRLETAMPLASRILALDEGRLLADGTAAEVTARLAHEGHPLLATMPTPVQVAAAVGEPPYPISVGQGRQWLIDYAASHVLSPLPAEIPLPLSAPLLTAENLWFRYEEAAEPILQGLSLTARRGELLAVLGSNGTGKSTALAVLAGHAKPQRGKVATAAPVGLLPQNPLTLLSEHTLAEDLRRVSQSDSQIAQVVNQLDLAPLLHRHPYDLSGGEQQRAALAKVLLQGAEVLLLDEPTKGLDGTAKAALAQLLQELQASGVAIVMASHDVEFCAQYATRCAILFQGALTTEETPRQFFSANYFYTTAASRMARGILPEAITAQDLITACNAVPPAVAPPAKKTAPPPEPPKPTLPPKPIRQSSRRQVVIALTTLLCIAATILSGVFLLGDDHYYTISMLLLAEGLLPFFLSFEGRRPSAREITLLASLCAICVAGRAATAMLPQLKPVAALVIISGAALGMEQGFLVGAVTMLTSNLMFGQGPWTPWQMLGMGLVGAVAGLLFYKKPWGRNRIMLALYGFVSVLGIYGLLLNAQSALSWHRTLTPSLLATYVAAGLPMDLVHAGGTAAFLLLLAPFFLTRLDRVLVKYFPPVTKK